MHNKILYNDIDIIEAKIWELQSILRRKKWEYLGAGRHRIVYRAPNGNRVIKIAHCVEGIEANKQEYLLSTDPCYRIQTLRFVNVPTAKVFGIGSVLGLSIISMEWVDSHTAFSLPAWSHNVDGRQVGINVDGEFVAYDFSMC
jgi:hypothetical protein